MLRLKKILVKYTSSTIITFNLKRKRTQQVILYVKYVITELDSRVAKEKKLKKIYYEGFLVLYVEDSIAFLCP